MGQEAAEKWTALWPLQTGRLLPRGFWVGVANAAVHPVVRPVGHDTSRPTRNTSWSSTTTRKSSRWRAAYWHARLPRQRGQERYGDVRIAGEAIDLVLLDLGLPWDGLDLT